MRSSRYPTRSRPCCPRAASGRGKVDRQSSSSARIAFAEKTVTIDRMLARSTCVALLLVSTAQADSTRASAPRMKAIVYHDYGAPDVLRLEDIEKPLPNDDELLIRVR